MSDHRHHPRAIAASTLWQMASQIAMAALSILTVKFVAVGLTKELAGNYNTAYGYLQFFGILADFGLYAVAVREVSRAEHPERVLGSLLVLRICILLLSLGSALAVVWIMPAWHGTPLPLSVTIASLVPFFTLLAGMLRTAFQVTHRMRYVFIAEVAQRIVSTATIGVFIVLGVRESADTSVLFIFLAAGGLGAMVLSLLSLVFAKKIMVIRPVWDPVMLRHLFRQAAPYGVAFLCTALYRQFDVTLIARLRPDYEIQNAYYGFVQRMMDMAYLLPTFLLNSTLPVLGERDKSGADARGLLGKVFLAILLLGTVSFLFALLWARPLTQLLTTEQYLSHPGQPGSDTALAILSVSMFMNGIILYSFYALLHRHAWKPLVMTLAAGVIVSLAGNIMLIPPLGFVGAARTSALVHTLLAVLLLPQAMKILPMRFGAREIRLWLLFTIFLLVPLALLRPFLVGSAVTAGALVAMGGWMLVLLRIMKLDRAFRAGPV
ncbi:MAG: Heteropolysaccharide repeat-containing protein [Candidatus Peregrinibacteria bacterium Greene0416_19]|nr:MAG: Heteropolysaccharide repeat-containing protein [Candidatus Peregrinibacteria bacterium Greene0416_19]